MIYDSHYFIGLINGKRPSSFKINSEDELIAYSSNAYDQKSLKPDELKDAFKQLRLNFSEQMRLDNVIFLLGNGTSIYAGSKNTNQTNLLKFLEDPVYADIECVINNISEKFPSSIEDQINALNTVSGFYNLMVDPKEQLVKKLLTALKASLLDDYVNSINYKDLFLHEAMLLKLRNFDCLNKTRIYTLNYDLTFEYILDKLKIRYVDGFSGFVNRVFDPQTLQNKSFTNLIKIHGSVNWLLDCGTIKEFQPRFVEDGDALLFKIDESKLKSVLIYPSSNKLYQTYASPYSELMRNMLDVLQIGRNLVVVLGYKYGDEHVNDVLIKSFQNPSNIYYFCNYDSKVHNDFIEIAKIHSKNMVNINIVEGRFLADFKNFVEYMLPSEPEKTDKEKALEYMKKVLVDNDF